MVECLCSTRAIELNSALVALRKHRGRWLTAAVSTSASLGRELELDAGEGLVVIGAGGLGSRPRFPENTLPFRADELQLWLAGVMDFTNPSKGTLHVPSNAELCSD